MRARIADVALELFARRGIDGVSISEIAVAAGVSKANVLHHFSTKDGVYAACLDAIDARLHAAVDEAVGGSSPVDDIEVALTRWARRHPADLRVMAYGLLRLPERDGRWALAEPVRRMTDLVATTDSGRDRDDALQVVIDLLGVVTYREMARPLLDAHRQEHLSSPTDLAARQEHRP
ncbi:MAG: helix-turn-helix domain-containing protein [Actinomycetota bacterium]